MSGGWLPNVLCVVAAVAATVGLIRMRLRVARLPGLASAPGSRRAGGGADDDAHPREADAPDDSDDDGDADDGGDGGDA
ncbi:hypothetical protein [Asanoa iriomotensis]|uniref:hypothetical protein n=1 Tax=Asanoa iriomotensis TaxID=234613 RepID=UPI0019422ECA|nr:hypothetical protein [Asanoa iriomotensis]